MLLPHIPFWFKKKKKPTQLRVHPDLQRWSYKAIVELWAPLSVWPAAPTDISERSAGNGPLTPSFSLHLSIACKSLMCPWFVALVSYPGCLVREASGCRRTAEEGAKHSCRAIFGRGNLINLYVLLPLSSLNPQPNELQNFLSHPPSAYWFFKLFMSCVLYSC